MSNPLYAELHLLIDGQTIRMTDAAVDVLDPATSDVLETLPLADEALLEQAVGAATSALKGWKARSARDRCAVLAQAARLVRERQEQLAIDLVRENGKPLAEAKTEIAGAADILDWFAEEGRRAYGRLIPSRETTSRMFTQREPVGVVALFMAWNYPAVNFVRKVAPALAAGCTIVAKPAEETPATPLAIAKCLVDAGLPRGVLNVVFGDPPKVSDYLIRHPSISKISFTGSTRVGRQLASLAGEHLKRSTMELGGHAPLIICEDADLERAARMAVGFKFRNAGQICTSPTRFYVQEKVAEAFVARFTELVSAIKVGPGMAADTVMGPLTHAGRQTAMEGLVEDARAGGAKVRHGGERGLRGGFYYAPTILTDVAPDSALLREEPFGPVVPIIRFGDLEDAIAAANDTPYGLAAYAFTQDLSRARRLTDGLDAGQVCINNFIPSLPETPAGGFKDSGWGQENGLEGLEPYLRTKFVHEAHFPT